MWERRKETHVHSGQAEAHVGELGTLRAAVLSRVVGKQAMLLAFLVCRGASCATRMAVICALELSVWRTYRTIVGWRVVSER